MEPRQQQQQAPPSRVRNSVPRVANQRLNTSMAELGLVASGVGIASIVIQVADSILKLKSFWDSVKGAPEDIRSLISEVEQLSIILSDVELTRNDHPDLDPVSTLRCLQYCREAAAILDTLIKEIDERIRKRKRLGSFQAVLKMETLVRLKDRLRNAQLLLVLSNQTHLEAMQIYRHNQQFQWAVAHHKELANLTANVSNLTGLVISQGAVLNQRALIAPLNVTTLQEKVLLPAPCILESHKIRFPQRPMKATYLRLMSFLSRVLEFYCVKAPYGWDFSMRVYNIVSEDSLVMRFAQDGQLAELKELFEDGKASLWDRTAEGLTLFDFAIVKQRVDVVRFLVGKGAIDTYGNNSNLEYRIQPFFLAIPDSYSTLPRESWWELLRLLAPISDFEELGNRAKLCRITTLFKGDADLFSWIVLNAECSFRSLGMQDRIAFAGYLLRYQGNALQPDAARLVKLVFEGVAIDSVVCNMTDGLGNSLLHGVAWNMSTVSNEQTHDRPFRGADGTLRCGVTDIRFRHCAQELLVLLQDVLAAGSDLHGLALQDHYHHQSHECPRRLQTPLMMVFSGYIISHTRNYFPKNKEYPTPSTAIAAAMVWLKQLHKAGVNLVAYGRREKEALLQNQVSKEWVTCRYLKEPFLRLLGFEYGPEPADWRFWFTQVMENYFVQFWEMVGYPERAMPGAWVENGEAHEWCFNFDLEFEMEV